MLRTTPRPLALPLDPFSPSPTTASFLPSKGLFSPANTTSSSCATIFEEEYIDSEDDPSSPNAGRFSRNFAIHPRMFRADSCSSDDDIDIPPVLKFPVPPTSIPTTVPGLSSRPRSPTRRDTIVVPPRNQLKSCFEDDDEPSVPSPSSSPRSVLRARLLPTRPAPPPPKPPINSSAPLALLKRATVAFTKTSSSPPRNSPIKRREDDKPLPKIPIRPKSSYSEDPHPYAVSPTPSLSSDSDSGSDRTVTSASTSAPYIPIGSIIPAPAVVQDLDDYLETLEMYFPQELWISDETPMPEPLPTLSPKQRRSVRPVASVAELKRRSSSSSSKASPSRSTSPFLSSYPSSSSSKTVTPGSRTPSPTTKPKSILKPSKSTPHLRARANSNASVAYRPFSPTSALISPSPNVISYTSRASYESTSSTSSRGRPQRNPIPTQLLIR